MPKRPKKPGVAAHQGSKNGVHLALWSAWGATRITPRSVVQTCSWPFLLGITTFINVLANGYVYDDPRVLAATERMSSLPDYRVLLSLRGLMYLTFRWDSVIWGDWGPGPHLTSVLLHGLASAVAALAVLAVSGRQRLGLIAGLLFAVHPVHVEAVASIANRKDVLAMIWVGLALTLWARGRGWLRLTGTVVCFVFALLSKEVAAIGLLPMFGFASFTLKNRAPTMPPFHRGVVLFAVVGVIVLGVMGFGQRHRITRVFRSEHITHLTEGSCRDYSDVLRTSSASVPRYAQLLILPVELRADDQTSMTTSRGSAAIGLTMFILWSGAIIFLYRRSHLACFACLWIVVMAFPMSNVVPLTRFFVAERYLYVPSWGFCLFLALALDYLFEKGARVRSPVLRRLAVSVTAVLILFGAGRSIARNRDWRTEISLWSADLKTRGGGTVRQYQNLGAALAEAGEYRMAARYFEEALGLWPDVGDIHYDLGLSLYLDGDIEGALKHFRRSSELMPTDEKAHLNLGLASLQLGDASSALRAFRQVLELNPSHIGAALNTAILEGDLSRGDESIDILNDLIREHPDLAESYFIRGGVFQRRGDSRAAAGNYRQALRLKPDYVPALVALSWLLSTGEDTVSDARDALALAERACASSRNDPRALRALAAAQAAGGQYDEALATGERCRRAVDMIDKPGFIASVDAMNLAFRERRNFVEQAPVLKLIDEVESWRVTP